MANSGQGEPQSEGHSRVALSYVDVLFGLAAGQCLKTTFEQSSRLPAPTWSHLAVAMTAITFSWIGYHGNRSREHPREPEFRPPFLLLAQLALDVVLVALYYILAVRIREHGLTLETSLFVVIAAGYLLWDVLDTQTVARRALRRAVVDAGLLGFFLLAYGASSALSRSDAVVVAFDVTYVAALFLYRVLLVYRSGPG